MSIKFEIAADKAATQIAQALDDTMGCEMGISVEYMAERIGFYLSDKWHPDYLQAFLDLAPTGVKREIEVFGERRGQGRAS